jgi:hypothetical protein
MPTLNLRLRKRPRFCFALLTAIGALLTTATANAQYSSSFYYHNPQTGFTYSQGATYGRGYYSGGFSYSTPQQSFSSNTGYGGGRYWNGLSYGTPGPASYRRSRYR